jgi:hypothetical protein
MRWRGWLDPVRGIRYRRVVSKLVVAVLAVTIIMGAVMLSRVLSRREQNVRSLERGESGKEELRKHLQEEERREVDKYAAYPYRLSIMIPALISPIERGERFEDPLQELLGEQGVVLGGGTSMFGGVAMTHVGVRIKDLEDGVALLRKFLKAQGAPRGTTISREEQVLYKLEE